MPMGTMTRVYKSPYNPKRQYRKRIKRAIRRTRNYVNPGKSIINFTSFKSPLPQKYSTVLDFDIGGSFSTAGANPVGFAGGQANFANIVLNSAFPLVNWGATTAWNGAALATRSGAVFDSLCNSSVYEDYMIKAVKISVWIYPQDTGDQCIASLTPGINSSVPANMANAISEPRTVARPFMAATLNKPVVLKISVAKLLGLKSLVVNNVDGSLSGTYAAAPGTSVYGILNIQTMDNLVPSFAVPYRIQIRQYIDFYNLLQGQAPE